MSQELNPHLKLINSWYFDFANMKAYRARKWEHYDVSDPDANTKKLIVFDDDGTIGKIFKDGSVTPYFFSEPEDNFNHMINQAYVDFLFEKQILVEEF